MGEYCSKERKGEEKRKQKRGDFEGQVVEGTGCRFYSGGGQKLLGMA